MKLIHYSRTPLELNPCSYLQDVDVKPGGLWVSVETGCTPDHSWKEWCLDEEFNLENLAYAYEVLLDSDANVLHLDTIEAMREFNAEYMCYTIPEAMIMNEVDWGHVTERYQGIIIAPYHYALRLHNDFFWYYTWDCASGCIWDLDAIESFEEIKQC